MLWCRGEGWREMWCAEAEREVCCGVEGRAGERCGV